MKKLFVLFLSLNFTISCGKFYANFGKEEKLKKQEINDNKLNIPDEAVQVKKKEVNANNPISSKEENQIKKGEINDNEDPKNIEEEYRQNIIDYNDKEKHRCVLREPTEKQQESIKRASIRKRLLQFCEQNHIDDEYEKTRFISYCESQITPKMNLEYKIMNNYWIAYNNDESIKNETINLNSNKKHLYDDEEDLYDDEEDLYDDEDLHDDEEKGILKEEVTKQANEAAADNLSQIKQCEDLIKNSIFVYVQEPFKAFLAKINSDTLKNLIMIANENGYEDKESLTDFLNAICEDNIHLEDKYIKMLTMEKVEQIEKIKNILSLIDNGTTKVYARNGIENEITPNSTNSTFNRITDNLNQESWEVIEKPPINEFFTYINFNSCFDINKLQQLQIIASSHPKNNGDRIQIKIEYIDIDPLINGLLIINIPDRIFCKDLIDCIKRYCIGTGKIHYKPYHDYGYNYVSHIDYYFDNHLFLFKGIVGVKNDDSLWLKSISRYIKKIDDLYYCDFTYDKTDHNKSNEKQNEIMRCLSGLLRYIEDYGNENRLLPQYWFFTKKFNDLFSKVRYIIISKDIIDHLEDDGDPFFSKGYDNIGYYSNIAEVLQSYSYRPIND